MKTVNLAAAAVIAIACAQGAFAQEAKSSTGWFHHEGALELAWDHADNGVDLLTAKAGYAATLRVHDRLTVQTLVTLWPLEPAQSDAAFKGEGAFIEELKVHYAGDTYSLYAGKFDAAFGSAFNLAPGLYGKEIGQGYQTVEKLGVGADIDLAASLPMGLPGHHVLSAAAFTSDRSALSGSVGTRRQRVRLADEGLGNTEGLKSYALSLDGEVSEDFGYSIGYRSIAAGPTDESSEQGVVAGAHFAYGDQAELRFTLFGEGATFEDADGLSGARRTSYTFSSMVEHDGWHGVIVGSGTRENQLAGGADLARLEFSAGRTFENGVTLDCGVQFVDDAGEHSTVFGTRLSFAFGG